MSDEDEKVEANLDCVRGEDVFKDIKLLKYRPAPVLADGFFHYKIADDGTLHYVVLDGEGVPMNFWVSDGYARIAEEMRKENGDTVFTIEGGTKDGRSFKFEMDAFDFAVEKKIKGKLTAQFGACNRVGSLKGDVIQRISTNVKKFQLIETPRWVDGQAAVPGLELVPNLRYATNPRVPVMVGGGNLSEAQQSLADLLYSWDLRQTTVVLAAVLGSPIVARWFPGDRFGLALTATTGSGKTEFIKNAMAIYGAGYLNEDNLMRWVAGATNNALMKVAASAGFLPFLADNYKPIKKDDPDNLIIFIQAVLEGSDKARLTSNSEFKDSLKFACIPIITGEDFPQESSTMARCLNLDWSQIHGTDRLTRAQNLAHNLPALGKEWLTWLSENEAVIEDVLKDYESIRSDSFKEILALSPGINAGRLSTTLSILVMVWKIALKCPAIAEIIQELSKSFDEGIEIISKKSPADVGTANEAEDFLSTLNELITAGRAKIVQDGINADRKDIIGWRQANGEICIFPKIAKKLVGSTSETPQALTSATLYKQLEERGYIKTERTQDGTHERTLVRYFGGKRSRVLVFKRGINL